MTTIKTTCDHCGDVELRPTDLALELDPNRESGSYRFCCPECQEVQRRPATARVVSVLLATGVAYEVINEDPITETEIDRFVAALHHEPNPIALLTT